MIAKARVSLIRLVPIAAIALALSAVPQADARSKHLSLSLPAVANGGARVTASGRVPGRSPGRRVVLQVRSRKRWRKLGRAVPSHGSYKVVFTAPNRAGVLIVRAVLYRHRRRIKVSRSHRLVIRVPHAPSATAAPASGGPAVAWGANEFGGLGTIYSNNWEARPVAVEGQGNIVAVASARLAVLSDGTVSAWGANVAGQLGDGTRAATWEKGVSHVLVRDLSGVRAVSAAGAQSLALLANGTVKTWGSNQFGQLGNGTGGFEVETHEPQNLPRTVNNLSEVTAISSGGGTNFVLLADHSVKAWGRDDKGQLGINVPEACRLGVGTGVCPEFECKGELGWQLCSKIPRPVEATDAAGRRVHLEGATAVAGGGEAAYALLKNGHVLAWGANGVGQLGFGKKTRVAEPRVPPTEVMDARTHRPLSGVVAIAAGYNHALALLETGEVVGWGSNGKGALGPTSESLCGQIPCDMAANTIPGLSPGGVTAIAAGVQYSLALSGGRVYAVGDDEHGELGDGKTSNNPVAHAVQGLEHVTSVSAGAIHVVAVLAAGSQTPAPLVTLVPRRASLYVSWNFGGLERLLAHTFEPNGMETGLPMLPPKTVKLDAPVATSGSAVIDELAGKPLETRPYVVRLKTATTTRAAVATPLP
jgi:alpha-tubulin suppressor-like RCC1 family protein